MSEENTVRVRRKPDGTFVQVLSDGSLRPVEGNTDWARLEAMSDEEIAINARTDPDNPLESDQELDWTRVVPNTKRIRADLGLTQEEFSNRFGIPLGTLRDWEQLARFPDTAARTLLRVIARHPDAVAEAVANARQMTAAAQH